MTDVRVSVRTGDCPCPVRYIGSPNGPITPDSIVHPHDEEWVDLMPEADLPLSLYAYKMLANAEGNWRAKEAALIAAYIPRAITAWSFVDEEGKAIPVTAENAERLIPWDRGGYAVLEKANDIYSERVLAPFLPPTTPKSLPTSRLSPTGQTDEPISAIPASGSTPRGRSKPSSPTS